ncbi:MAG: alpha-2-macroglobulin [Bacteroidales bacterium]|nr:alpha-2-macroglobulin [Bacteroidales bacterium]
MNRFVALLVAGLAFVSCVGNKAVKTPSPEVYAQYIKAYTGGIVGQDAAIKVELAQDAPACPTEGVFSFKPALEGTTRWESPSVVTFVPAALTPGRQYKAVFSLSSVLEGAPKTFEFGFAVRKEAAAEDEEIDTGAGFRVRGARLSGSFVDVVFSEAPVNAALRGMIELDGVSRSYVQLADTLVRVHFEGRRGDMTLSVDKGVKSAAGEPLAQAFTKVFKEGEEKPAVSIPLSGTILPDKDKLLIPFRAANLNAVEVRVVKIYEKNVLMFLQDNELDGRSGLRRCGRLVFKGDIPLEADNLHTWNDHCLDLRNLIKQEPGAIYSVRVSFRLDQSLYGGKEPMRIISTTGITKEDNTVWDAQNPWYWDNDYDWDEYNWQDADDPATPSYYMDSDRFPSVRILASDIGLVAQYADGDELWIAATDLISAKPLGGVSVEAFDYQLQSLAKGKTGADGLAKLKISHRPFAVVGKAGGSTAYLKLGGSGLSLSRFDVGGQVLQDGLKAYIYGERGVWRPGDTLHVAAVVKSLPDGHPGVLEVYTPAGQFYAKYVRHAGDGFFSFDIPTRADDPTGYWNAYLKIGGSSFHKTLHVETVKPNRLKINTDFPKVLESGKSVAVPVAAQWLSGGVAGNCPVNARMTLRRLEGAPFRGFEKYSFVNPASGFKSSETELYKGMLGAGGSLNAVVKLPAAQDAPGMLQAFIVTSVQESGGDESFTTATVPFSPYSAYVGIKVPEGDYLETDKDHQLRVAVLDAYGSRVKGHKIEYAIYKTGWNWWWESPSGDLDSWIGGSSVERISSGAFTSGADDSRLTLRVNYPDWGRYMVLVRDITSGHVSGRHVTVDWPEYRGRADRRDPEWASMLTFSTDKPSYKAGEQATVFIPAAKGSQALVSLENSRGVIDRKWVELSETDTPWSFTVTEDMAPNFYIHITLVRPYSVTAGSEPIRLYGVQRVLVDNPASRIEPVLELPKVLRPEEKFTVKVSEKSGRPMTYTLAVVDEGLLDLTAFKTPNPWEAMYKPEALGVKTWDIYDSVIGAFGGRLGSVSAVGGDEDAMVSARKDNRFNPVVLYVPPRTLKKGTDKLELQLPMYVGSVRVMIVAGHDGSYGSADATVPVQSPLMVVTTLPRAIGVGEKISVPVNVFSMEEGLKEAVVSLKADGPVKITGSSSRSITFDGTADKMVSFGLEATSEGLAHITVNASGAGHKTYETIAVEVVNPNPETTTVESFTLAAGASRQLDGGFAQLSVFPALDASGIFADMKNYPYSCGEQLSAKGLTFLHLLPLLSEKEAAEARALIEGIISALYARQNADGGFGYWSGGASCGWVSSMAGQFLTQASKAGFDVNPGVLKAWKDYQVKMVKVFRLVGDRFFDNLDQAYRLYTLAVAGEDVAAGMNRMKEAGEIGERAAWMLSCAYAVSGKKQTAEKVLESLGRDFPEYEPYNITYGNSFRDKMVALHSLSLTGRIADALALARENLPDGSLSTQESAFAAMAFSQLFKVVPTQAVNACLNGSEIVSAGALVSVPDASGRLENHSEGPLYVTVCTSSREASRKALSNGLALEVKYLDDEGRILNPASLRQGTRMKAVVIVTNLCGRPLENLSLSLAVPSGWEIVNDRLVGGASEGYDYKDIRDTRVDWFYSLPAGRYKTFTVQLRAAYEGTFVLPSVVAAAMYEPSVNASTAASTATVTR